jgi:hypothetical protein
MADHVATQTKHPWRATARTIIEFGTGFAVAAPVLYTAVTNQSPEQATGAGLTALLVAGAVTRVMNTPFVDKWLTRLGLGATPKGTSGTDATA